MRILPCVATAIACLASQSVHAALTITEVASTSGAPAGVLEGLDWWELTNSGPGSVLLDAYEWEDNPIEGETAIFPSGITILPGKSIIIHDGDDPGIPAAFRANWGLDASVQVLIGDQFGGANSFSGLSSGGDRVFLFDDLGVQVAGVVFGAATSGVSFEWDTAGASLGLSVAGEKGAYAIANGRVGSPGVAVPEPTSLVFAGLAICGLACGRRRRR